MIFKDANELFSYLISYYKRNGGKVDIATFGMYLGITEEKDWGSIYRNKVREFINSVDKKDLRLILGIPAYHECREGCRDCHEKYVKTLRRHRLTIEKLGLKARVHNKIHLKMYRVGDLFISGGINLTASHDIDASFVITDESQRKYLANLFDNTWNELEYNDVALP